MPQSHDALFRRIFSDPAVAAEVLRGALPPEVVACIDLSSFVLQPGSYVDDDLRATHSDLVFSARIIGPDRTTRDARLFILLEHQSSPNGLMPFRLLRYGVRVWDRFIVEHPDPKKLPLIDLLRVTGEITDWKGHAPEQREAMWDHVARLAELGVEAIED